MLKEIYIGCFRQGHQNQLINSETWCISELYWSSLKDYDTGKTKKCVVNISDDWGSELEEYTDLSDYKSIKLFFDFEQYLKSDKQEKKRMQLDTLHSGMMRIAQEEGWETNPLLDAYNGCLEKSLMYKFLVNNKLKVSPDRKHKIGFWCNWDIDKFEVYWVLFDKDNNEIKRSLLIEKEPFSGEFIYYVHWKWKDKETVLLEDKYKYGNNEKWEFNIF